LSDNPKVYLIKIVNEDKSLYKIGFTKGSVHKRIRELQTGCPYEIKVVNTYDSEYGTVIESALHNMFIHKKTFGEWFSLDLEDEVKFMKLCETYENNQKIINDKCK